MIICLVPACKSEQTVFSSGRAHSTIQEAIDAASEGGVVFVGPGTYNENIDFCGKGITVEGSGPGVTIIDGGRSGSTVTFATSGLREAVIRDLTITNGLADKGGGIRCSGEGSLTIINCCIAGNEAREDGGGVYSATTCLVFVGANVASNSAYYDGGGIYTISDVVITMNNSIAAHNTASTGVGGGIYCGTDVSGNFTNVVIADNDQEGVYVYFSSVRFLNSIIWDNTDQAIFADLGAGVSITYCDVQGGWPGWGNIDKTPMFADHTGYHLQGISPCIDAGVPDEDFEDACQPPGRGEPHSDMGAYGGPGSCDEAPACGDDPCWDYDEDGHLDIVCGGDDCDDTDPDINPSMEEDCDNGIDDDCDGLVDAEDPECETTEFVLELDTSYESGTLSLYFTIGVPEPATWINYLVLTYPSTTFIPLWAVPLPIIDPAIEVPISFAFPQIGEIGIWTGLFTEEGMEVDVFAWVDTSS